MPEPGHTGSNEESFKCPVCGEMFPTDGQDEKNCPNDGFHCTRDKCLVMDTSDVGF